MEHYSPCLINDLYTAYTLANASRVVAHLTVIDIWQSALHNQDYPPRRLPHAQR